MTQKIDIDLKGPAFFCPDCGRWLATFHDGMFDLAGHATVELDARIDLDEGVADGYGMSATCLLLRCRLRRLWHRLLWWLA